MAPTDPDDEEVGGLLSADADAIGGAADLWALIDAELDQPGWRDPLVSLSTPVRQLLAVLGLVLTGVVLVAAQGVREDLDATGWQLFAVSAGALVVAAILGARTTLRAWSRAPVRGWTLVPLVWAFMMLWAAVAPWPGMPNVPFEMHLYCFGMTSMVVLASLLWMGLLERSPQPVVWRMGLAGAVGGLAAFAAQGVFCPGIDWVHLVVGHGGAGIVWALVAMGVSAIWARLAA
ncbi:MAG: hypothetical protein KTR31_17325 [Myxococcales bacterium]|nr:hypothetical protein [Myxococcales bacterium]